jgi:5-formyltetrahydrofolate cyclo-ligase
LAFDKKGIAWVTAKGFTINFLSECKPDVIKIGLALSSNPEEIVKMFFLKAIYNWIIA